MHATIIARRRVLRVRPDQAHRTGSFGLPADGRAFPDGLAGGEVRAALAALPSGMRAAIVPRHWLDLSAGETAELLNCSEGTVKSLTFQIAGGQWVVVQAPVSLGWNSAELAKFASGVQVLVTAQQGQG